MHFTKHYYVPNNAILVVAGNIDIERVKADIDLFFSPIPSGEIGAKLITAEPKQTAFRDMQVSANVPLDCIYLAFHMDARKSDEYYTSDLISDILSIGRSSRFFQELYKKEYFTNIDAYISGTSDPGLFIIEGKPCPGISLAEGEKLIWNELEKLKNELVEERELKKVQNKMETSLLFAETSIMNKAMSLAYFEELGDAAMVNQEVGKYKAVSPGQIMAKSQSLFTLDNCSRIIYLASS